MMIINPKDKQFFDKLSVNSILELALIIPTSYSDLTLSKTPKINQINTLQVKILNVFNQSKFLKITALAWNSEINIIIFNPKKFHFGIFKVGMIYFVQGKLEYNFGKLQLIQPKVVNEVGKVLPVYKTSLQQKTLQRLMNEYLTVETLMNENISKKSAELLYDFHNPTCECDYEKKFQTIFPTLKYLEIFSFLKKLNSKKRYFKASAILNGKVGDFITSLPFNLTSDQKKVIDEIKIDLAKDIAARRVIMGDVGSGKTIIILACAMMAYPKKSILMVPTTILSNQIFEEAKKFLPKYVKVTLIESKDKDVNMDEFDFIIGTHVLLYRTLPDCDLVMIDEQHRFGTQQRDAISRLVSKKGDRPHFLQFSATPIPRTLTLINSSLVDYSFIKETPFKKDISTFIVSKSDFGKILGHVENEIKFNNQIAIIYPLVEENEKIEYQSIEEGRIFWENRYKNVYVTFGKDKQKDKILEEFKNKGSILIATTVVEVGVSLPNLSTIIVVGAERLGLATLHQLRGRVSRNGLKGYCFLYTNDKNIERLNEFVKTTNGFDIAELDLKYRQSGDILGGVMQHGVQFRWFDIKNDKHILLDAQKDLKIQNSSYM